MTDIPLLTFIVSVLLPVLVGLVTKASWPSGLRATLLLALSAANGFLTEWIAGPSGYDIKLGLYAAVTSFVVGTATYFGVYKPFGLGDALAHRGVKD